MIFEKRHTYDVCLRIINNLPVRIQS